MGDCPTHSDGESSLFAPDGMKWAAWDLLSRHAPDIIIFSRHADGRIIDANDAALKAYGYSRDELLSLDMPALYDQPFSSGQDPLTADGAPYECLHIRKDGSVFPVEVSTAQGDVGGERVLLHIIRDIARRRRTEERPRYIGAHDPITGLLNRAAFEQEVYNIERSRHSCMGILVCDVDDLRVINVTRGHEKGDKLICDVANALKTHVVGRSVVARTGGDEFSAIIFKTDLGAMSGMASSIRNSVMRANTWEDGSFGSVSVGFAMCENARDIRIAVENAGDSLGREKLRRSLTSKSAIVQTLMATLEERDIVTGEHSSRLQTISMRFARVLGLEDDVADDLGIFSTFHDIGKVATPDRILLKPGPLTLEERREMQRHCEAGQRIALASEDLSPFADWILKHHESWDGSGYPLGISGEDIPLMCRILAIVDAFDAITSDRPYRRGAPREHALEELARCAGTQFDPDLVGAFLRNADYIVPPESGGCAQISDTLGQDTLGHDGDLYIQ